MKLRITIELTRATSRASTIGVTIGVPEPLSLTAVLK